MKYRITSNFVSLYALILCLSISLVAMHTLRTLSLKKEMLLALYIQKQSMLYATTVKEIALACLDKLSFKDCKEDSMSLDPYFQAEYRLSPLNSKTHGRGDLLLDVSVYTDTLLSSAPVRFGRRYILRGFA